MKVGQTGSHTIPAGESPAAKQTGRAGNAHEVKETKESKRPAPSDSDKASSKGGAKAEISAKAKDFSRAKSVATDAPDVRDERIAELKRRISEGSYHVDSDAIADRMVDEHLRTSDMGG